jgi:pimeloyl-ACP methyl ester carboxylesterase
MAELRFRSLPEAEYFILTTPDGAELPVYSLGGPAGAPGLLVGHANGLAAGSYGPWLVELASELRVFAFDARGHGGSSWPPGPLDEVFHVDRFADDLSLVAATVQARLGRANLHLAAHSLNAAAALRLATRDAPLPWSATLLFEPPIFPAPQSPHFAEAAAKQTPLIERSARRRVRWQSPVAMRNLLGARGIFQRFRPDLLTAHCRAALRPFEGGGFVLACPPAVESVIFRGHRLADTWQRLPAIGADIHLVSGDPALPDRGWIAALSPEMAARIPRARLTVLRYCGHMMIFEEPEMCRRMVLEEVQRRESRYA